MPHVPVHPSAIKRHRSSLKRRVRNRFVKAHVHTVLKRAAEAVNSNDAAAEGALREAMKALGKAASKGVIHHNTASRKVARLAAALSKAKAAAG